MNKKIIACGICVLGIVIGGIIALKPLYKVATMEVCAKDVFEKINVYGDKHLETFKSCFEAGVYDFNEPETGLIEALSINHEGMFISVKKCNTTQTGMYFMISTIKESFKGAGIKSIFKDLDVAMIDIPITIYCNEHKSNVGEMIFTDPSSLYGDAIINHNEINKVVSIKTAEAEINNDRAYYAISLSSKFMQENMSDKKEEVSEIIEIGMSSDDVIRIWGKPNKVNTTITEYSMSQQWCYDSNKYVYLDDGTVSAIQY